MKGAPHRYHEDHVAEKYEFITSQQSSAQIYFYASSNENTRCKGRAEHNGKNLKKPAWQLTQVRNKNEVIAEARNKGNTVHVASLMDLCHLKNSELEPKFQKYKGRVVLRGYSVKDDSGMLYLPSKGHRHHN